MRLKRRTALILGGVLTMLVAAPSAFASGNTEWVSTATPSAPFDSCAHPGSSSIQKAIDGSAKKIEVCGGTYVEQLRIERPVTIAGNGAHLKLPATPARSETPCDAASEAGDGLEDQDLISVCTAGEVKIRGLDAEAIWPGNPIESGVSCAYNLYGIFVAGGADLQLDESSVVGAAPAAINGCQYGVGIQIGASYASPAQVAKAKLKADVITRYQKNGVTVDGSGSQATIDDVGVTGAGPTAEIAQNGIGVQFGAKATITDSVIRRNECENATCGPEPLSDYQAEGVYFYGAATGSRLVESELAENDAGVETFSTAATEPTAPQVLISGNAIRSNRDEGVLINQGYVKLAGGEITDSKVGIAAIQVGEGPFAQAYGPRAIVSNTTIHGMSEWAVAGDSDDLPADKPGSLKIVNSAISGNPGPTPEESVHTDNPAQLPIVLEKDT